MSCWAQNKSKANFPGKCIFRVDDSSAWRSDSAFLELELKTRGRRKTTTTTIMVYGEDWLQEYYYDPLKAIGESRNYNLSTNISRLALQIRHQLNSFYEKIRSS